MFIVDVKYGACATFTAENLWFDCVSSTHLSWLPRKFLDASAYFVLYEFTIRMGKDPVLTTLPVKRCIEVDSEKIVTMNSLLLHVFHNRKMLSVDKESVQEV